MVLGIYTDGWYGARIYSKGVTDKAVHIATLLHPPSFQHSRVLPGKNIFLEA